MPTEILMPALSPTMEEGTLAKWLVKEGDTVSSGDLLAEIETDKATMEFEAVDEGTIGKILIPEGTEGVKVNTAIAVLLEDGESADDIAAAPAKPPRRHQPPRATRLPRQRRPRRPPLRRPLRSKRMAVVSSLLLWPDGSPRRKASIWHRSQALARMAASSRRMSKARRPLRHPLPRQPPRAAACDRTGGGLWTVRGYGRADV